MDSRIEAHLIVAGALLFLLFVLELWHRQWLPALACAVMTTTLLALAVISMRRNKHHRNGRR
jgi:Flp pilus assembly protein TadB